MKKYRTLFLAGNITKFDATPIKIFDMISHLGDRLEAPVVIGLVKLDQFLKAGSSRDVRQKFADIGVKLVIIPRIFPFTFIYIGCYALLKRYRLIHANNYTASVTGCFVKKVFGRRLIYDYHGAVAEEMVENGYWKQGGFKFSVAKFLEKMALKAADHVIVISKAGKDYIREFIKMDKDISVVPCGIKHQIFHLDDGFRAEERARLGWNGKFVVCYNGSLAPWNDYGKMMRVIRQILAIRKETVVLFLTKNDRQEVSDLFRKYDVPEDNLTVMRLEHTEVGRMLNIADLGLLLRNETLVNSIASPMKFAEYLACGVPVVVTKNVGDTNSQVVENDLGEIVDDEISDERVHSLIAGILSHRGETAVRCSRFAVENFDMKNYTEVYEKVYEELLQ